MLDFPSIRTVFRPAAARPVALSVIVVTAIAGAYALALVNHPQASPAPYPYVMNAARMASDAGAFTYGATNGRKSAARRPSGASGGGLPSNIIRTGDITVRLKSTTVLGAKQDLVAMLRSFPGSYLASNSTYDHNRYLDLQLEVPAGDFPAVFHRLERNFGKVESESTTTQDVGLQVVNLNARLQNLEAQRITLLKLFNKATTVADTIRVQNVLSSVEGQIEQTQGQIKYLAHQIDMSAISVEFVAKNAGHHTGSNAIFNAFGSAGKGIVNVVSGAIVVVGYALPLTILGIALYALILLAVRLYSRRRRHNQPAPAVS